MKTLILTFTAIIFFVGQTVSQQVQRSKQIEIDAFYNWSLVGTNISLMVNKPFDRHVLSFGVKIPRQSIYH